MNRYFAVPFPVFWYGAVVEFVEWRINACKYWADRMKSLFFQIYWLLLIVCKWEDKHLAKLCCWFESTYFEFRWGNENHVALVIVCKKQSFTDKSGLKASITNDETIQVFYVLSGSFQSWSSQNISYLEHI